MTAARGAVGGRGYGPFPQRGYRLTAEASARTRSP